MSAGEESRRVERTYVFAADLIEAGRIPGFGGLRWRPFVRRDDVKAELARLGYELCEDGANHDPRLRVFFAVELKEAS